MTEAIVIDYGFCSGCHSCEIACKNEHDIPLGQWGIKITEVRPFVMDNGRTEWDYVPVPTELCDLCVERRATGEQAACELVCQCKSIFVGDINSMASKAAAIGKKAALFVV